MEVPGSASSQIATPLGGELPGLNDLSADVFDRPMDSRSERGMCNEGIQVDVYLLSILLIAN